MLSRYILGSFFEKNKKNCILISFSGKKVTSSNAMGRFSKNQKFAENDLKKNKKKGNKKNQRVFSHYIDYRLHDYNKKTF